jgi:WD40 repeat protein
MTLKKWDPAPTVERLTLEGHLAPIWDCVVFKGGSLIASAAGDGTIRIWDLRGERQQRLLEVGVGADVQTLSYSPDGYLLAAGHDSTISLWDIATGQRADEANVDCGGITSCEFTLDGTRVLLGCEDGSLRLWDVDTWSELAELRGHTDLVSCVTPITLDSSLAVSGSKDGTLRLWDLGCGEELHVFAGHTDAVWGCAVNSTGAFLASVSWDGDLRLWSLASRVPIAAYSTLQRLRSVAIHPSRLRVACGDHRGWVHVFDILGLG